MVIPLGALTRGKLDPQKAKNYLRTINHVSQKTTWTGKSEQSKWVTVMVQPASIEGERSSERLRGETSDCDVIQRERHGLGLSGLFMAFFCFGRLASPQISFIFRVSSLFFSLLSVAFHVLSVSICFIVSVLAYHLLFSMRRAVRLVRPGHEVATAHRAL